MYMNYDGCCCMYSNGKPYCTCRQDEAFEEGLRNELEDATRGLSPVIDKSWVWDFILSETFLADNCDVVDALVINALRDEDISDSVDLLRRTLVDALAERSEIQNMYRNYLNSVSGDEYE